MNDLQAARTLIPQKQSCNRHAAVDDFICTETHEADGSKPKGIPKRLFFFSRCRDEQANQQQQQQQQQKFLAHTARGSRGISFFIFYFYLYIYIIKYYIIIYLIKFNFEAYICHRRPRARRTRGCARCAA